MRIHAIFAISFVASVCLTETAKCQLTDHVDKTDTGLFRSVKPSELDELKKTDGVVIGEYFLSAAAVKSLCKSKELANGIRRIQVVEWTKSPFDRKNAELTIRQRMDDYLDTAVKFYDGKGTRTERQKDLTDLEIGDQQLSNALQSMKMAHVWSVPLGWGQAEKLAKAIEKRYAIAHPSPTDLK